MARQPGVRCLRQKRLEPLLTWGTDRMSVTSMLQHSFAHELGVRRQYVFANNALRQKTIRETYELE
jgi:hypothetical protein